jgi:hypothetical protein
VILLHDARKQQDKMKVIVLDFAMKSVIIVEKASELEDYIIACANYT